MPRPKHPEELAPLGFRLPVTLIERIDAYCERMEAAMHGHRVSRSDAIRVLLLRALDAEGIPHPAAPKAEQPPAKPAKAPKRK